VPPAGLLPPPPALLARGVLDLGLGDRFAHLPRI